MLELSILLLIEMRLFKSDLRLLKQLAKQWNMSIPAERTKGERLLRLKTLQRTY
jgi:hypothetical protein